MIISFIKEGTFVQTCKKRNQQGGKIYFYSTVYNK